MTDVRLTATNPEDSSVVPVACNSRGELLLVDPVIEEIPNDVNFDGDVVITGTLAVWDASSFKASAFDGAVTFSQDAVINGVNIGRGGGNLETNIALGFSALVVNTTGNSNTAVGHSALMTNTEAARNTAVGSSSLRNNTTGNSNTAVGNGSLKENTEADGGTAVGTNALTNNTTGDWNTAVGNNALTNNTEGERNVAVGSSPLRNNTKGSLNTAVGTNALTNNTEGDRNVAVGTNAGHSLTGNNNTFIGSYQGASWLSDTLSISTGQTERLRISADDTVDFNQKCGFTSDGGLWITDQRGNKLRTTFASNGFMEWGEYVFETRSEPQILDVE